MPPKSAPPKSRPHPETDTLLPSYIATLVNPKHLTSSTTHEKYVGGIEAESNVNANAASEDNTNTVGVNGGKRSGDGALLWPNGNCYMGQWRGGTMHGLGTFLYAVEGDKYIGSFIEDKKHGEGTYTFSNGNYFKGEFVADKRHGEGTYVWTCGDSYQGQWRDGHMEGKGRTAYANGNTYSGDFVRDRREGFGKLTCADGLSYEGDWLKNMRHGQGTLSFPNGDAYVGQWANDKKHGMGKDCFAESGNVYEGFYRENVKDGYGVLVYGGVGGDKASALMDVSVVGGAIVSSSTTAAPSSSASSSFGDSYQGMWSRDKMHGPYGAYVFRATGYVYIGPWCENMRDTSATAAAAQQLQQGIYLYPCPSTSTYSHSSAAYFKFMNVAPQFVAADAEKYMSSPPPSADAANGPSSPPPLPDPASLTEGTFYIGGWLRDKKHGKGLLRVAKTSSSSSSSSSSTTSSPSSHNYLYADPSYIFYEGQWANGKMNGEFAVFTLLTPSSTSSNSDNRVPLFRGEWKDGLLIRGTYAIHRKNNSNKDLTIDLAGTFELPASSRSSKLAAGASPSSSPQMLGGDQLLPLLHPAQLDAAVLAREYEETFGVLARRQQHFLFSLGEEEEGSVNTASSTTSRTRSPPFGFGINRRDVKLFAGDPTDDDAMVNGEGDDGNNATAAIVEDEKSKSSINSSSRSLLPPSSSKSTTATAANALNNGSMAKRPPSSSGGSQKASSGQGTAAAAAALSRNGSAAPSSAAVRRSGSAASASSKPHPTTAKSSSAALAKRRDSSSSTPPPPLTSHPMPPKATAAGEGDNSGEAPSSSSSALPRPPTKVREALEALRQQDVAEANAIARRVLFGGSGCGGLEEGNGDALPPPAEKKQTAAAEATLKTLHALSDKVSRYEDQQTNVHLRQQLAMVKALWTDNSANRKRLRELWKAGGGVAAADRSDSTKAAAADGGGDNVLLIVTEKMAEISQLKLDSETETENLRIAKLELQRLREVGKKRKEVAQQKEKNEELEKVVAKLQTEIDALNNDKIPKMEAKKAEMAAKSASTADLKSQISATEKNIDALKKELETTNAELAKLRREQQLSRANAKKKHLESMEQIFALEGEIKKHQAVIDADDARRAAATAAYAEDERAVLELEKFVKQLQSKKSDLESLIKTSEEKLNGKCELRDRMDTRGDRIVRLRTELEALGGEERAKMSEIEQIREEFSKSQRQRDAELINAQGKLATAEAQLNDSLAKAGHLLNSMSSPPPCLTGNASANFNGNASSSNNNNNNVARGPMRRRQSTSNISTISSAALSSVTAIEVVDADYDPAAERMELDKRSMMLKITLQEKKKQLSGLENDLKSVEKSIDDMTNAKSAASEKAKRAQGASREIIFNQLTKVRNTNTKLLKDNDALRQRLEQLQSEDSEDTLNDQIEAANAINKIILTIRPDEWRLTYLRNQLEQRAATMHELQREVGRIPLLEEQIGALRSEVSMTM